MKKFIFSKFGGLQAYSRQLYYQMTPSQVFFTSILCTPHATPPPCFDLNPPSPASNFEELPMFATPLVNPAFGGEKDSEVVIKATSYKFFLKIQVHLLFGCFGICIYSIDSVTSVTFYRL